ncbi:protein HGV2-like isoform X2 [Ornithodoros turicata]|uniref:protein HGV2-like isoform X2 n=1 Tax=Ornithodoros turicata TaxID=34597 RepID=UPI003138A54E
MAEAAEPTPATTEEGINTDGVDGAMLLLQGKRHLLVQDYPSAVISLQDACKLLASKYGETANECGEAYRCYGTALLELARQETGVLGNALEDESPSEEEEEEEEDGEEDEAEKQEAEGNKEGAAEDSSGAEKSAEAEEDLEKEEPVLKEDPHISAEPGTSSAAPQEKVDEDEVSNLQLAWEVLELAKVIFKRQAAEGNADALGKVADILLKLGEISIESDNCEQAVEDLSECLNIQRETLAADSRQLAETHYQRGLAHSFAGQYNNAVDDFRAAVGALQLRVENLTKFIEENKSKERQGSLDDDPVWRAEREVEELQGLLPEVKAKVEDTEDMMRQDCKAIKDAAIQKMMDRSPATSPVKNAGSAEPTVNVITHLVKRKRPTDESGNDSTSSPIKRQKAETPTKNGESTTTASPTNNEKPVPKMQHILS